MRTKDKILVTALQLLNEHGVKSVTIRDIAAEMGISHGNLGYHYANMELIIYALYEQLVKERKSFELASIKSKYEIASAEQENILKMAKQTAIQESQVQKQRFLKNLFIVGCFFFIVTIVFLVYTNNLKKRKNAELAD